MNRRMALRINLDGVKEMVTLKKTGMYRAWASKLWKQALCQKCGLDIDTGPNASINILTAAGLAGSNACGGVARSQLWEAAIVESGTIRGGSR